MTITLMTSGSVLLLTCAIFFYYEFLTFKTKAVNQLSTLGRIIAANSTAALAFDNPDDATLVLSALQAEPHIIAAGLYDSKGRLFCHYPTNLSISAFPASPGKEEFQFRRSDLAGFQPIILGNKQIGTLYIESDLGTIYDRFQMYGKVTVLAILMSFILAYFLSRNLQRRISKPILSLAETALTISNRNDYSVRATKFSNDELGTLTDAFNHMLIQIEIQNAELETFNHTLEEQVTKRTEQLKVVNEELEAFSYSVSHDLRAPLRAVNGYAKILEDEYNSVFDDEGKRLLGVVQHNANRMAQLIDDLLAFSRLGRKEITKSFIKMKDLAELALAEINKTTTHHARVIIHDLHPVIGDYSLINQVMVNLLSNAIKYSSNTEEPVIEIKSVEQDHEIIYSITDNGSGFDNRYVDKLFGVFQRLHTKEEFEGTGVGLALVKRIITKHRGKVSATGEINKGATFCFSLPNENGV